MGIGAKDHIDRLLVRRYQNEKPDLVTNVSELAVPPNEMLQTMNDYANSYRNMLTLQSRLKNICRDATLSAVYSKARATAGA